MPRWKIAIAMSGQKLIELKSFLTKLQSESGAKMIVELLAWGVATVLACTMLLVVRGFLPIAFRDDGSAVYHLSRGVTLILIAVATRAVYWDVLPVIANLAQPGLWFLWSQSIGRPLPNIITGLVLFAGGRHLLILQWLLIPEPDRVRYSIWSAPFYPQRVCILRGVDALRKVWRK